MATNQNTDSLSQTDIEAISSNESTEDTVGNDPQDPDLDDLLDSALEDFDKPAALQVKPEVKHQEDATNGLPTQESLASPDTGDLSNQQEALFNELFTMAGGDEGPGAAGLEDMMRQLMGGAQPDLLQQLESLADGIDDIVPPEGSGAGVNETLQQTMNNLAQNAQGIQDAAPEADLLRMMSGMGLSDDGAGADGADLDFLPMMQTMMKSLMSKEVLYPSLKEISDKYPAWLENNKNKLSDTDFDNYTKQQTLMRSIVVEFESEKPEDTDDVKKHRFDRIMDTMQRMQEMGQPPKDLVGDMPAGFEMDGNGLPKLPGGPDQCSVM